MTDYPAFGKIPRLHRPVVITEKIDGTNALVSIREATFEDTQLGDPFPADGEVWVWKQDRTQGALIVRAGSRNRWLTLDADNYGFAAWVRANAESLVGLGEGRHYGEWYGRGIQRGYGLPGRRFGLFNVARWYDPREEDADAYHEMMPNAAPCPDVCTVVPILQVSEGANLNTGVAGALYMLKGCGSMAVDGWREPEGLVVFHLAAGQYFKVLIDQDATPKGAGTDGYRDPPANGQYYSRADDQREGMGGAA